MIISFLFSSLGAAVVGLLVGFGRGETFDLDLLALAFAAGLVVNTTAGLLWRKANMADSDISFNVLGYAIPVLALQFLFSFDQADITRVDYLILGATAIIVANLLINFEAEVRWSFEALILALGGCGTLVYFRVDIFEWLGFPTEPGLEMGISGRSRSPPLHSRCCWRSGWPGWSPGPATRKNALSVS